MSRPYNDSSAPYSPIWPVFFPPLFLSSFIREEENKMWKIGKGAGDKGGVRWGCRVRKQMKAVFFSQRYRSELHAMPHTNNGDFSFHLKVPAWPHTQHSFYRTHCRVSQKNAHTLFLFAIFPTFLPLPSASLHPTMSSVWSTSFVRFPSYTGLTEWTKAWERENCPFTPLDWQRLRLFLSPHWSYHYFSWTKYECTLSWCDAQ